MPAKKRSKKSSKKTTKKSSQSRSKRKKKPSEALAIIALILNLVVLPGLGTLIAGKTRTGIWQIVLILVGLVLSLIIIGIPLVIAAWIWGLVSGVKLVQEAFD